MRRSSARKAGRRLARAQVCAIALTAIFSVLVSCASETDKPPTSDGPRPADAGVDAPTIDTAAPDAVPPDAVAPDVALSHKALALTVAHVADTHAQLLPTTPNLKLAGADTAVSLGGYARLVAKVAALRASAKNLLVLHAGDVFQGTLFFTRYLGMADLELLELLGLDAMVVGNHEFDRGPKPLADFVAAAKASFPVLGGNVDASQEPDLDGQLAPYTIEERDGERVAIIGLVTPDVPTISSPGDTVRFADHVARAHALVREVTAKGVNKVVLLTHLGYDADLALAQAVEGIDVIVGGHSHTLAGDAAKLAELQANPAYGGVPLAPTAGYPTEVTGPTGKRVCVVHAWSQARAVGVLDVQLDADGFVTQCAGNPVLLLGETFMRFNPQASKVEEVTGQDRTDIVDAIDTTPLAEIVAGDPAAAALIGDETTGFVKEVDAFKQQQAADVTEDLVHVYIPGQHYLTGVDYPHGSLLAPHVAAGLRWYVGQHGITAHVAVINAGGIKKDLLKGPCSVGDVYEMLPYNNTLVLLGLTGQQIKDQIEQAVSNAHENVSKTGARFPYVAGLRYTADMTRAEGQRITSIELEQGGHYAPLQLGAGYTVVTLGFLAAGGDLYEVFRDASGARYDTGLIDAEAFAAYAQAKQSLAAPAETGVTYVPPPAP